MGSNKDTQTQLQILGPMKDQVQYVDCEQRPQACEPGTDRRRAHVADPRS